MRADLRLLREQLDRCKGILARLSGATGGVRAEGGRAEALAPALTAMLERWRVQHPQTRLDASITLASPERRVVLDLAFEQALHNLMNNAAQASPAPGNKCGVADRGDFEPLAQFAAQAFFVERLLMPPAVKDFSTVRTDDSLLIQAFVVRNGSHQPSARTQDA